MKGLWSAHKDKIMKRYIFTIVPGMLMMILASTASASTGLFISPSSINVKEDQNFDVSITVNPQSVNNYTAKIQLQYPADILELKSFTFDDGWMVFSHAEYDLIDNTNGILIKTAGFPGGFSTLVPFGTALFSVKKDGEGIIKIGEDSFVFDISGKDVFDGFLDETTIKITALTPSEEVTSEEEIIDEEDVSEEEFVVDEEETYEEVISEEATSTEEIATSSPALFDILTAPATEQVPKKSSLPTILIVIFILMPIGYILYRKRNKKLYNEKVEEKDTDPPSVDGQKEVADEE